MSLKPLYIIKHNSQQKITLVISCMRDKPFKFSQNISHKDPAFHSSVDGVVVLKESKHVPTVLHSQTSDELLNHLNKGRQDINNHVITVCADKKKDPVEKYIPVYFVSCRATFKMY